ncbi:ABC transporter permease subunit [Heliobacterium gestii]|uniref:ABC transporter permease subunit n=1 Tax=Heliomicrobium gestii TaxID=2699 RepID=A0A845LH42_HELGE|nr:ABC transporter permease [Heliomicrobium gestii]MBM7867543.1 NitT/TauT family transport system permease protein [Heliomicrobium gestii]MZP43909.1 ABC transporter permease subunit [Heliomicrobium gestii]
MRRLRSGLAMVGAALVLIALWQLLAQAVHNPMLPTPGEAFRAFGISFSGPLPSHLWASTFRVLVSLFLSILLAVPAGLFLGRNPKADRWVAPVVFLTYPIPKIVFLPLVLLFLGIGDASKVFLITLIVSYQILVTTRDAARSVREYDLLSLRSLGGSGWDLYRHVIIPACVPDILTSLRISMGTAVAVLFLVESFATTEGLGYYIMDAWSRAASAEMFAGIIAMGLLGFALILLVDLAEAWLCRWQAAEQDME